MKKGLAGILALLLLVGTLASCKKPDSPETDSGSQDTPQQTEVEPIEGVLLFKKGEKTAYRIVYEDDLGDATLSAIKYAVSRLNTLYEGIELEAFSVSKCPAEAGAKEILLGNTDRAASAEAKKLLTAENEYVVKLFADGTLCIYGTDESMLQKGVSYLMNKHAAVSANYLALTESFEHRESQTNRTGWRISAPLYQKGEYAENTYNTGVGLTKDELAGNMQIIRKTNGEEFNAYRTRLTENGYTQVVENQVNGNVYVQYQKDDSLLYTYYLPSMGEVRVIEDRVSVSETAFEYSYTPNDGEETVFYNYSLMASPRGNVVDAEDPNITYTNNGMFYVIRLADNSVVLIDGGNSHHANRDSTQALLDFLYEITGTPTTEKVRIACIFFTHLHGDHISLTKQLITDYSSRLTVERAMYNNSAQRFAKSSGWDEMDSTFYSFTDFLKQTYPNIKFLKPHTGQSIRLADADFQIVVTHEDLVNSKTGKTLLEEFNSTSTVLKITVNNRSILLLGDWGGNMDEPSAYDAMENYFLQPYKTDTGYSFLQCDAVQVAHHGINSWMGNIYAAVRAKVVLLPTSDSWNYATAGMTGITTVIDQTKVAGATTYCFHNRYLIEVNFAENGLELTNHDPVGVTEAYKTYLAGYTPATP